jgi:alpha-tubulin suppressor-like RCC1 family protein
MMNGWTNLIPCCDADLMPSMEGPWSPVFAPLTKPDTQISLSGALSQSSEVSQYEWETVEDQQRFLMNKNGLKGGAATVQDSKEPSQAAKSPPPPPKLPTVEHIADSSAYDGGILQLPSFDYTHIHEGQNDMVSTESQKPVQTPQSARRKKHPAFPTILESPEEKKDEHSDKAALMPTQQFFHGVPVFLSTLSQMRITKVSAHPLGAHVLLISAEALLFTYGLNNHGQLGIGIQSNIKDENRGFHTAPTLITPLLENGGKAINCAAGVDHSLVVVATEGRRLQKLPTNPNVMYSEHGALTLARVTSSPARVTSSPSRLSTEDDDEDTNGLDGDESVRHHQIYGFGSNDFMKIGLISAKLADDGAEGDVEDILLPRRVALHCNVWPQTDSASSSEYPPQGVFHIAASVEHSAALVRRATGDIEVYMWGNATVGALGLPVTQDPRIKVKGGLTRRPTSNANNIFPLPTVVESLSYRPNRDSILEFPRGISLGPYSSFVVMSTGRCMSFGFSAEGMLGQGYGVTHTMDPKEVFLPSEKGAEEGNGIVSISAGAFHAIAVTENGQAYSWGINSDDRLGLGTDEFVNITTDQNTSQGSLVVIEWVPQKIEIGAHPSQDSMRVVRACAGYDSSMLVAKSGQVLCFGKRSGRLGKGELAKDVSVPQPMHGGLRLFYNTVRKKPEPLHKRMQSDSGAASAS